MASSETEARSTRVDVAPVVVGVGDDQVASVLVAVAVGVADQTGLPVVVEVGVGDGDVVRTVGHITETIVVVLVVVHVGRQVAVVDPDVGRGLDGDGITSIGENLGDLNVADDDVGLVLDAETNTVQRRAGGTDDGLVGADVDLLRAGDLYREWVSECSLGCKVAS